MLKVSIFNAQTWDKKFTENSRNIHGKFTEEFTAKFTEYFLQNNHGSNFATKRGEVLQTNHGKA